MASSRLKQIPWQVQESGTDASLRGIGVVSGKMAWASGTKGAVLRTTDGGKRWEKVGVPGAERLDFRDIAAFDERSALVLSSGTGDASRIYKTTDGGKQWRLLFTNTEAEAFYDGFAFWDRTHGLAMSDPVDGMFRLLITEDGETWKPLTPVTMPAALPDEAGFAASGTSIAVAGKNDAWFVTGGAAARIFHSSDRGKRWQATPSPLISGAASQGIFSIAGTDTGRGKRTLVIVGGDYANARAGTNNAARSPDGGKTWTLAEKKPGGYRSAVAFVPGSSPLTCIAVGTSGSDYSRDGGKTWLQLDNEDYNALSFAPTGEGWAVGPRGRIACLLRIPDK
jgi:photosystem II stability/assembly factor-like uncharacterized protein